MLAALFLFVLLFAQTWSSRRSFLPLVPIVADWAFAAPLETLHTSQTTQPTQTNGERDVWRSPASSAHLARRYAWIHATRSSLDPRLTLQHLPLRNLCLKPQTASHNSSFNESRCFASALVGPLQTAPACILEHIYIHRTYIYGGEVVSLVDISQTLWKIRPRVFYCPSGVQPIMVQHSVGEWIQNLFKHITHTSAWFRCPASNKENEHGIIIVNYNGDCSFNAATMDGLFNTTKIFKNTHLLLMPTPISQSFQQAWPDLPVRGNAYLSLPNVTKPAGMPFQFSTCAMGGVFDSDAPFLSAWLWHLRNQVLVEHVILYIAPEAFHLDTPHINATLLKEYLEDGYLTLVPWASRFINGQQIYYRSQQMAYSDYAFRFRGMCHWTFMADADDFFVNWSHNHQMAPLISSVLKEHPGADAIRINWPLLLPQCHNITGHEPSINSSWALENITHGYLNDPNPKQILAVHDRQEIHIHTTRGKHVSPKQPGLAVYHLRTGPHIGYKLSNYSKSECDRYRLQKFDAEARKTHKF